MSSYTFEVGSRPRIEIRVQTGRVDCSTEEPGRIAVEVGGSGADGVIVEQHGDTIVVREEKGGWLRGGPVRITATVPVGCDVEVAGAAVDVRLEGEVGELTVKSASGDVWFDASSRLEIKTASGDIRGGRVDGDATVSSASGDAYLELVAGDLTAKLASGDVDVERVDGDLDAQTASGDVRVQRCGADQIWLKSISGDLHLGLPGGIRLEADFTSLSGSIHLPERRDLSDESDRRRVKMNAKTVSGDIRIETIPSS